MCGDTELLILLINGKIKLFGPASEEDVKKAIQEEIEQIKH